MPTTTSASTRSSPPGSTPTATQSPPWMPRRASELREASSRSQSTSPCFCPAESRPTAARPCRTSEASGWLCIWSTALLASLMNSRSTEESWRAAKLERPATAASTNSSATAASTRCSCGSESSACTTLWNETDTPSRSSRAASPRRACETSSVSTRAAVSSEHSCCSACASSSEDRIASTFPFWHALRMASSLADRPFLPPPPPLPPRLPILLVRFLPRLPCFLPRPSPPALWAACLCAAARPICPTLKPRCSSEAAEARPAPFFLPLPILSTRPSGDGGGGVWRRGGFRRGVDSPSIEGSRHPLEGC